MVEVRATKVKCCSVKRVRFELRTGVWNFLVSSGFGSSSEKGVEFCSV